MTPAPGDVVAPIEVVIAVHTAQRPVRRAVDSVLRDPVGARVIVVAHGLDPRELDPQLESLEPEDAVRVRVVPFADGVRSPAGPFNAGIALVCGEWFAVLGSDDWLEDGALSAWSTATAAGAGARASRRQTQHPDVVLAPLRHQSGADVPTPLPRHGRTRALDAAGDRLFYRTAPLGLLRTESWRAQGAAFDARVRSGDDIEVSARLWSSGLRVDYARHAPRYVIGTDATDRVTSAPASAAEVLAAVLTTASAPWAVQRAPRIRRSLAVKLARTHVLGLVAGRVAAGGAARGDGDARFTDDDARSLHETMVAISALSTGWPGAFTRADRWVLDACAQESSGAAEIVAAARRRAAAGLWSRNLPVVPWGVLDRESTLLRYLTTARDARAVRRHRTDRPHPPRPVHDGAAA